MPGRTCFCPSYTYSAPGDEGHFDIRVAGDACLMATEVPRVALENWRAVDPEKLKADVLAGVTVSLVAVPQSLAYAQLAGLPPIHGLYAALIPTLVGALAGSSAILSTGPVAMTSLLTAASIAPLATQGSEKFVDYAILLALLSGLFQFGFGLLRMGVLLNFLSHPVLMGFINAAALIIGLSQVPTLLGINSPRSDYFLLDIFSVFSRVGESETRSVAFGLLSLAALGMFKRYLPAWPGILITVTALTFVSSWIGYEAGGGKVVGNIPQGLPVLGLPKLDAMAALALLPASFVIALISFMEAMSSSKVIAIRTRTTWDENRELIGQGLAKIAAAFCLSMPVSGSFSRSALNLASGARTKLSSLVSALSVAFTLLFLTQFLHHLPRAVLAAVIMMAVVNLVNVRIIANAWRANIDDGVAGTITFFATLLFAPNIQNGILTGILLSLALMLYRLMKPRIAVLGIVEESTLRERSRPHVETLGPALGALRFDGALLFINVSYFEDAIIELWRRNPSYQKILVKCSGVNRIDASGVEMLFNLVEHFKSNGVTLVFSGLKEQTLDVMQRSGLVDIIGAGNIFATDREALEVLRGLRNRNVISGSDDSTISQPLLTPFVEAEKDERTLGMRGAFDGSRPMRILVPVDGSQAAQRAVEAAIEMAKAAAGSSIVLLNAQSAQESEYSGSDLLLPHAVEMEEFDRLAADAFRSVGTLCTRSSIPYRTRKERGPLAATVARVASEENVDQIVFPVSSGHTRHRPFRKRLSEDLIDLADVPVTIVKH